MRILVVAALALGIGSAPVAAATMQPDDILSGSLGSVGTSVINLTLNLVQQISVPITVNQAFAIAINSQNVFANAETTVISINETTSYMIDLGNASRAGQPLDLSFLEELFVALGIPGLDLTAALGPIALPQPGAGSPGSDGDNLAPVPLPAALPLSLIGLAGLGLMGWRRRA